MELRPAYNLTDCGPIPEDWRLRRVSDMGDVITGKALAVDGRGDLRPYLRTKNVFDGRIDIDDVLSMPMTDEQFRQFMLEEGDVLLNEGQSLELVGRCAIYRGEYPGPCGIQNQLLRFRAHKGVSGLFASHLFRYSQEKGVFAHVALQTTSIAHLGSTRFEQLVLPWPPSEAEQRAIAAALSDVDALLDGLDQLIAKKRDVKRGVTQQLLSGQTRLPGFSGGWEMKRIREFASCTAGGTPSTLVSEYWGGSIRWMKSGELHLKRIRDVDGRITKLGLLNSGSKMLPIDCVLVGLAGQGKTRGTVAMNLVPLSTNQSIAAILPNSTFVSDYLYHNLNSRYDELRDLSSGSGGRGGLNLTIIGSIVIALPSVSEQSAIATVLSDMDSEIAALEARRDKTQDLKQAMVQELLTGRTRLVQPEVANA